MNRSLVFVIFIVLGIAVAGYGVYVQFFQTKGFVSTTGTIDRIDSTYMGYNDETMEDEYEYTAYVKYTVDGQEYSGKLDVYDQSYEEGKQVDIMYNPANPSDMHNEPGLFGVVMMAVGVIVALGSVVMLIREHGIA